MRSRFDEQLEELNVALIHMGALCEDAIGGALRALLEGREDAAAAAFSADALIDQKERDIETLCMKLLLQQQPVARDLRTISSALKMISDMERIGDQAADIAEITRFIQKDQPDQPLRRLHLREMANAAIHMVKSSIESFVRKDLACARGVVAYDDVVDGLFAKVRAELVALIASGAPGEACLDYLMIAKYLERIGDHAVNIAEWVEYALTGVHSSNEHAHGVDAP